MSQVLQKLRDVDPNDSDAVKEVISSFFQNLLKHKDVNCNVWLRLLDDVITRYPRYCAQHRATIENYLAHFLDSNNYYNVIEAAKCAHGLQQICPSQEKAATPKNCWREQMNILCNAAHTLIEAIFSKTMDVYKNTRNVKKKVAELLANTPLTLALSRILTVNKPQGTSVDKNMVLCNKLRNIFVFIQAMLVEVYPVAKPIQPQVILEVIVQALSVSSSVDTDVTDAVTVKTQALRTLDAIVLCLGADLIPFSGLVFRFVMQTLKWSSEHPSEESRKVRVTAYNSLNKWLSTLHVHRISSDGRGRSLEDELTKHIVDDITPIRKIVQLTMSNQYTKNLSKKAKRKLANTMLQQSTIAAHMPGEQNKTNMSPESSDEVANAALECAETFLTVSGIFLKPTTHKIFQERLVRECYNLESYSVTRSLCLLRALDAARKSIPSTVPPPTQYCVQLYSTLVNSRCDEIRKFCSQALLDIRLHLHCSPPSINFAVEPQVETKADKNKRREVSKKNREALQALLGEDRMPPEQEAGEPSNKRPRLEEDRISISSEESVVIADVDSSDDEVEEIVQENSEKDTDPETESTQEKENEESSQINDDNEQTTHSNIVSIEDSADASEKDHNTQDSNAAIHDAKTQLPLNNSNDTIDDGDKSPVSLEVAYDATDSRGKVTIIEKTDEDNLPSTNDTDDVQITCGQIVVSSQESEPAKPAENEVEVPADSVPHHTSEITENGAAKETEKSEIITGDNIEVHITSKEITLEDMLADFVDEVQEEPSLVA